MRQLPRLTLLCTSLSILTALLTAPPAHAGEPIAIESLAKLPAMQSVSMSPDGKHIVALIPSPQDPDETALATWDTTDLKHGPKVVTPSGDRMKFIQAAALKADRILAIGRQEWTGQLGGCGEGSTSGATKTFVTKAYLTTEDQKGFDEAFADNTRKLGVSSDTLKCLELGGTASLLDMLPSDPDRVIIQQLSGVSLTANYYLYNLRTKETELLFRGGSRSSPSLFDPRTAKVLAKSQIEAAGNDYEQQVLLLDPASGQFSVHAPLTTKLSDRYTVDVVGVDDASGKYYVLTDLFSDKVQARLYDPAQRKFDPEALVADANFSISALVFGNQPSNFNKIVGFVIGGPSNQTVYVDPKLKGIQGSLEHAYPQQHVRIDRYTDDFSKVLFTVESAAQPPSYHLLNNGKEVVDIGAMRPWIANAQTGQERWVTYKARDGRQIPAILDLPAGWKEGDAPAPAIINPHGGPWGRDYMGWDPTG